MNILFLINRLLKETESPHTKMGRQQRDHKNLLESALFCTYRRERVIKCFVSAGQKNYTENVGSL